MPSFFNFRKRFESRVPFSTELIMDKADWNKAQRLENTDGYEKLGWRADVFAFPGDTYQGKKVPEGKCAVKIRRHNGKEDLDVDINLIDLEDFITFITGESKLHLKLKWPREAKL